MTDFKIGDRVRCYDGYDDLIGEVIKIDGDALIVNSRYGIKAAYNKKQCRKLVKKERKRLWVSEFGSVSVTPQTGEGWTEFVEVRKK